MIKSKNLTEYLKFIKRLKYIQASRPTTENKMTNAEIKKMIEKHIKQEEKKF